jgi:hypothetical protein
MLRRQAGIEIFWILSLVDAYQGHLLKFRGFFNPTVHTWYREYCVTIICLLGATMTGLFQISAIVSIRRPFRARRLIFFCLTLLLYVRSMASVWKWFGVGDYTHSYQLRYPINGRFSWFFTAHTRLTLMAPVCNAGMLGWSKRAHCYVNVGIILLSIWCYSTDSFVPGGGANWENA